MTGRKNSPVNRDSLPGVQQGVQQNSPAKFRSFPERALLFHNNSPVTLHYSPATTILNEIPGTVVDFII